MEYDLNQQALGYWLTNNNIADLWYSATEA